MEKNSLINKDLAARAAWMYYIYQMTQEEISITMKISRQKVQRLIALALKENFVNFAINHDIVECQKLSLSLKKKFNLSLVEIAPSKSEDSENLDGISNLAAKTIDSFLPLKRSMNLVFGSGRTLAKVSDKISPISCFQHNIISNMGNHRSDGSEPRYFVLGKISQHVESNFFPFPVPIIASSKKIKDFFYNYHPVKQTIVLINNYDACFFSVGCILKKDTTPLLIDKIITEKEFLILKDLGAIGEINGLCFDEKGSIIEINDSLFPTTYLPTFRDNKPIVAVGGGAFRAKALKAAIEGKLINGLITDELTAKMILNQ